MILYHDVDGCLNPEDGATLGFRREELSSSSRTSLQALGKALDASAVDYFVLNTGRSWATSRYLCEEINSTKVRFAFAVHASQLWNVASGEQIDLLGIAHSLGSADLTKALSGIVEMDRLIEWFAMEGALKLANRLGYPGRFTPAFDKTSNLTFAIPRSIDGHTLVGILKDLIAVEPSINSASFIYHHSAPEGFIDVMPGVDKSTGVALMRGVVGHNNMQTAAIGNGLNDLPMLEAVDIAICPNNAEPQVRAYCSQRGGLSGRNYIGATLDWLGKV